MGTAGARHLDSRGDTYQTARPLLGAITGRFVKVSPSPADNTVATASKCGTIHLRTDGQERAEKILVIVESPAKAKTINKYLGDDYVVKARMGHVRDLPSKGMGVDLKTFEPEYEILEEPAGKVDQRAEEAGQGRARDLSGNRLGPRRRSHRLASEGSAGHSR